MNILFKKILGHGNKQLAKRKTLKKVFFSVLLMLFIINTSKAQEIIVTGDPSKLTKRSIEVINSSKYIFEGTVIGSKKHYNSDSTQFYGVSIFVKVQGIYKGLSLRDSIVEFIMERDNYDPQYIGMHGPPGYGTGRNYILFCKDLSVKFTPTLFKGNITKRVSLTNDYYGQIAYTESKFGPEMFGFQGIEFKTKAELEEILSKFKGIKVPKKKVLDVEGEGSIPKLAPNFDRFMQERYALVEIAKNNKLKKSTGNYRPSSSSNASEASASNELNLVFANNTITTSGSTKYYEFDVMVSANNSGTFLSNALIRFDYNTSVFGSSIASSSALTIQNGSSFPSAKYDKNKSDANSSRATIAIGDYYNAPSYNRTPISTTPVQLLHVKIKINSCGSSTDILISDVESTANFSLYTTSATADESTAMMYDNTVYNNQLDASLCPLVNNFYPKIIHSGNNEILTITGSGFGSTQGNVLFKKADNGGNTYLTGLDNVYVKSWSNDLIEVYVPSLVYENYIGTDRPGGACSGVFKVINANSLEYETSQVLDIEYAMLNVGNSNDNIPYNLYQLVKRNCIDGIIFTLHNSLAGYPVAISTIETALNDWSNKLGITLKLENNETNLVYVADVNTPNKNVIYFDNSYAKIAETSIVPVGIEENGQNTKYYRLNADIRIIHPNSKSWHFRTDDTRPRGNIDFYEMITHEIGHAIGLDHALDIPNGTKEVMYYAVINDQINDTPYGSRVRLNNYGTRAGNGGIAKIAIDKSTSWTTPSLYTLGTSGGSTPTDLFTKDMDTEDGTEPNPNSTLEYWSSTDIWIKNERPLQGNDGQHENPEYTAGQPVYVYVKVRNKGCTPSAGNDKLKLYWAKASTGLAWPQPWDGSLNTGSLDMGDPIGVQTIGVVNGESYQIFEFSWQPPNPDDYAAEFGGEKGHFCFLSRIEEVNKPNNGMYEVETSNLWGNVKSNNNIAWKNVTLHNDILGIVGGGGGTKKSCVIVRNVDNSFAPISLRVDVPPNELSNSFFNAGLVQLELDQKLFQRWVLGGMQGNGIAVTGTTINILNQGAWIGNIALPKNVAYNTCLQFTSLADKQIGQVANIYSLNLVQSNANGVVGGEKFIITVNPNNYVSREQDNSEEIKQAVVATSTPIVYPNPATTSITIEALFDNPTSVKTEVIDMLGRSVIVLPSDEITNGTFVKSIDLNNLPTGIYTVKINVGDKVYLHKVLKE